ncbi:MAG: AMP-binding protein [bacterium]|nr:AMP-binding protein [bacterium]
MKLLYKLKCKIRDTVIIEFPNSVEQIVIFLACWISQMTVIPISPKTPSDLKEYKIRKAQANKTISKENISLELLAEVNVSTAYKKIVNDILDKLAVSNDNIQLILFTSGTTAYPKGAQLSLNNLFANAEGIIDWFSLSESDRFFITLPLHHINGITSFVATLISGGTIILLNKYTRSKFFSYAIKNNATTSSIIPLIASDLLRVNISNESINFIKKNHTFKGIQIGSSPVNPDVVINFYNTFTVKLFQAFGNTETSMRSTGIDVNIKEKEYLRLVKLNTIGHELKYTNVIILNNKGEPVGTDILGEICVRGPIIMKGYINNKHKTLQAFKFGWFHTGDYGFWKIINDKKYFFTKGRIDEIINKGGIKISPLAIEQKILKSIINLVDTIVVGLPDERYGEIIGAVLVWKDGVEHIIPSEIEGLIPYEQPSKYISLSKSNIQRTFTGKIKRSSLKDYFVE